MDGLYLSKPFMLKLNKVSHKFQLLAQQIIRNQQEARRHQAINANDHYLFVKAVQETNGRQVKIAVDVEDIVFDYFGIISVQYELANKRLEDDADYIRMKQ